VPTTDNNAGVAAASPELPNTLVFTMAAAEPADKTPTNERMVANLAFIVFSS
jgi:hypothetical protein